MAPPCGSALAAHSGGSPAIARATARAIEGAQVIGLLADADRVDRKAELLGRRDQDAAAGGAVELGHDEPGHSRALAEHLNLGKRVLTGSGVEHEQDVVRRFGVEAAEDAADFRQLLHQVRLVLQAAGGVDDQYVLARRGRLLDAIEDDAGGVAAFLAAR